MDTKLKTHDANPQKGFVVQINASENFGLKVEHHLIALRALEARPLAHSNRSYRRIARGEQDPLVLVRRTPRARRRYTSSQARKEANLASELGQRASELKLST